MKILGLVGDNIGYKVENLVNKSLIKAEKHSDNIELLLINLKNNNLEFCDGRDYLDYGYDTRFIVSSIIKADIIIIGTPIYQASIPGILKNLLDILPEQALKNKPVGIIGAGGTPKHHLAIEYQLKPILNFMGANVINKYVFSDRGENIDLDERLDRLVIDLIGSVNNAY